MKYYLFNQTTLCHACAPVSAHATDVPLTLYKWECATCKKITLTERGNALIQAEKKRIFGYYHNVSYFASAKGTAFLCNTCFIKRKYPDELSWLKLPGDVYSYDNFHAQMSGYETVGTGQALSCHDCGKAIQRKSEEKKTTRKPRASKQTMKTHAPVRLRNFR